MVKTESPDTPVATDTSPGTPGKTIAERADRGCHGSAGCTGRASGGDGEGVALVTWARLRSFPVLTGKGPWHRGEVSGEQGAASVEFLLVAPVLVLLVLLLVQWSVKLEAERAADAAAREGAVAAARWDGTAATGRQTAMDYLSRLDPHLTNRAIVATRGTATAQVTITGDVLSLVPLVDLHVNATATTPVETFTP